MQNHIDIIDLSINRFIMAALKSIVKHKGLARTDIRWQPGGLVRTKTDIRLRPSLLIRTRADIW